MDLHFSLGYDLIEHSKETRAIPKRFIKYENWGSNKEWYHTFPPHLSGIHFNTALMSDWVLNNLKEHGAVRMNENEWIDIKNQNLKIYNKKVVDKKYTNKKWDLIFEDNSIQTYDYVIDCTGMPSDINSKNFELHNDIPVNSALIYKTKIKNKKPFNGSRHIAHDIGWCWAIDTLDECTYGFLYNRNLHSKEKAEKLFKELLDKEKVNVTNDIYSLKFDNYIRKNIIKDNYMYLGLSGYFLEPMEATTSWLNTQTYRHIWGYIAGEHSAEYANEAIHNDYMACKDTIMLHYLSPYKKQNSFWKDALHKAITYFKTPSQGVQEMVMHCMSWTNPHDKADFAHGPMSSLSWYQHYTKIKDIDYTKLIQ